MYYERLRKLCDRYRHHLTPDELLEVDDIEACRQNFAGIVEAVNLIPGLRAALLTSDRHKRAVAVEDCLRSMTTVSGALTFIGFDVPFVLDVDRINDLSEAERVDVANELAAFYFLARKSRELAATTAK